VQVAAFVRGYINEEDWAAKSISYMRAVTEWRAHERCEEILQAANVPEKRAEFERYHNL
jgi:hypothetical protein